MEVQLGLNLEADKEELYWAQQLEDAAGRRTTSSKEFLQIATDYFGKLFSASEGGSDEHLFGLVERKVTDRMNERLLKQFTDEEIVNAIKSLAPLKAPGVDGFPALFFQRYWHIIGPEVSQFCLSVLHGHSNIGDINKTRIVLIPKVDKPKNMSHFRPISLCTIIYKIIAKVLVLRMSDLLGLCIHESQGAFIPGRLISDNVLVAYEILHSLKMKRRGKKGNFALKLDMSKAYDRVEWDYLAGMMKHLGFHLNWITLIMRCVCSVTYSVSLNGTVSDWFSPSRGLRQGDPLSPYLFLICAEGFSLLLQDAKVKGKMMGAPIGREKFSVNHLFFTDDCILFGDATREGTELVRDIIQEYEVVSGQRVNFDKSLTYFGANVASDVQEEIIDLLGARLASNPEKYLGLPMMVGRRKKWAFAHFVDRFRKRVEGWSMRYLSMGGKEVWRILSQPQCLLAKVLKARYFPFFDILTVKVGSYTSFTWRSICSARELIGEGILWRVGNGDRVNIWNDPWLPGRENNRIPIQKIWPAWTTVNQLFSNGNSIWNRELVHKLVDVDTANRIFSIPISEQRPEDVLVWKHEGSGEFTVRSGYRVLFTERLQNVLSNSNEDYKCFYTNLWALNIPSKIKIHVWRVFNNLVPHYGNLNRRTLCVETACPLCKEVLEDTEHLLWSCGVLRSVWTSLQIKLPHFDASLDYKNCFVSTFLAEDGRQRRLISISLWCLWYHRNKLVHEGVKFSMSKVLGFIRGYDHDTWLVNKNPLLSSGCRGKDIWRPPESDIIKLNFDASYLPEKKIAITTVLARDSW
ncbi:uncharacterized protein [Gossypium hirsutum]|uniref:Reverse transcriptase domain-containing protein n=1 Tax=Gossypium hirsutum TaxID=3635 RepID=A0A1U8J5G5_GOSHI|nr:uncharacterized protein LOC107902151 [Gossypium hirsutum]